MKGQIQIKGHYWCGTLQTRIAFCDRGVWIRVRTATCRPGHQNHGKLAGQKLTSLDHNILVVSSCDLTCVAAVYDKQKERILGVRMKGFQETEIHLLLSLPMACMSIFEQKIMGL